MSKKAELIANYFPTIYLTVISLLQGIALSQLIPYLITYLNVVDHPLSDIHILPLLLMLMIIFVVWHHYAIGIFFLRWFPNIIDTILPFFISIGQFVLISYLNIKTSVADIQMDPWMKGFAIFQVMGSLAYFSAAWRLEPDLFTNIMSQENAVLHCKRSNRYYNLAAISMLVQGMFAFVIVMLDYEHLLLISLLLFLAHLAKSEYYLLRIIKPPFLKAMDDLEEEKNK
jgi:hypothetical protein